MNGKMGWIALIAVLGYLAPVRAQRSFDQYVPLQSVGTVPADFSIATRQKIETDTRGQRGGLTAKQQKVFLEQINYTIDGLLHSGLVTYGDEVSQYVQRIGNRLTENDPDLKGKLRFYILNSNEANAFSTDQGMVFVTTGLISQMTNEAQLAFVLAHEIIHYSQEHVLDLYDYVTDNRSLSYGEKVRFFSKYSRDNEFEADKKGVKLYHDAGYASSEMIKTFDVLIYSYLPFEEIPFPKDYFNSERMYVPERYFKGQKSDITAKQKYNDRLTSHPNTAKRIEALNTEIAAYADWGTVLNYPEQSFRDVRAVCRFEYLLNDVYSEKPVDALYSIFLLERDYPSSHFLALCKAQVWLELMKEEAMAEFGQYSFGSRDFETYEGEIATLNLMLARVPHEGKIAMGLRIIYDGYLEDTINIPMRRMWDKAIEVASLSEDFSLDQFSAFTFREAIVHQEEAKLSEQADTTLAASSKWNKYDIINNKRSGLTIDSGIDSSKFYLYALSDLVKNESFKERFAYFSKKARDKEQKEEKFFLMTDAQQLDEQEEKQKSLLHLGIDTLLLVNPFVTETTKNGQVDFQQSEELERTLLDAVRAVSRDLHIVVSQLDRTDLTTITTTRYNDLATIMRSMEKGVTNSGPDVFLIDLEILDTLKSRYGSSKVMLLALDHQYNDRINLLNGVVFSILFPVGLVYFPIAILNGHSTELRVFIMDLDKGEMVINTSYFSRDPASEKMLESRLNALFHQLNQPVHETN